MKADISTLKDTFKIGYDALESSRNEADAVWDQYHNRQYTEEQLSTLANRGQPAETFNVVKLFARMIIGYYSTVINTAIANPVQYGDIETASLLNDIISYTLRTNSFTTEGDKIKLSAIISGLMCVYEEVYPTGRKDRFGRPIMRIALEHVPDSEIVLDPMSRRDDYSDARFIHRFKWISEDDINRLYGATASTKLQEYYNHLNIDEADFAFSYNGEFTGNYRIFNNYLVVHSVIVDDKNKVWSIHWCDEVELYRKEITRKEVKWPYRVHKLHTSDKAEYYGIFREVVETQRAINQALIKIQLMVNTHKVLVEDGAVENIDAFTDSFNRVNSIIPVNDLNGIRVESLSKEIVDQYTIIDKAFDRIQRILSINDSFLGMAFASDSGRKVKLQQNATITALRYLTNRIEAFYKLVGWDIALLAKQYYTAEETLRIVDETVGARWIQINKPMMLFTGKIDETGQPIMEPMFEEVKDPANGETVVDENGNVLIAPIPEAETEIAFTDVDIEMSTAVYNDEDEKNQLMLETILSGNIGSLLSQINPAGFFKAASLSIKSMKTKHSTDISEILNQTAMMVGGSPEASQQASLIAQGQGAPQQPGSMSLKLPTNTNEGVD